MRTQIRQMQQTWGTRLIQRTRRIWRIRRIFIYLFKSLFTVGIDDSQS